MGCVDVGRGHVSSIAIVDLGEVASKMRRVINIGHSIASLHLDNEKVVAGGDGWLGVWRVLNKDNYSRQVMICLCEFNKLID